jgi:hypothetical protein
LLRIRRDRNGADEAEDDGEAERGTTKPHDSSRATSERGGASKFDPDAVAAQALRSGAHPELRLAS